MDRTPPNNIKNYFNKSNCREREREKQKCLRDVLPVRFSLGLLNAILVLCSVNSPRDVKCSQWRLSDGVFTDPVHERRHPGVDTRIFGLCASDSPTDDAGLDPRRTGRRLDE